MSVDTSKPLAAVLQDLSQRKVAILTGRGAQLNIAQAKGQAVEFVDLTHLNKVVEYKREDQVITVETGMTVSQLDNLLVKNSQWLPVSADDQCSLVEVINNGDAGYLEHGFGGLRNLILGLTVALPNGETIKMGGQVVKNVTGYDLAKLFIGAQGTLGVPLSATLRLYARPEENLALLVFARLPQKLSSLTAALSRSGLPIAGLDIFAGAICQNCLSSMPLAELTEKEKGAENLLLLNLSGQKDVLAEVLSEVEAIIKIDEITFHRLPADHHDQANKAIFAKLTGYGQLFLDASLSLSQAEKLMAALKEKKLPIDFHFRPGVGRMRLFYKNEKDLNEILNILSQIAQPRSPLTVAYSDDQYALRVKRLPEEDQALQKIKRELKQRFDPNGCMNPFVLL